MKPLFDSRQMTQYMHEVEGFERVLHVAHHEWHGIRHATAYGPGHKLLISANSPLSPEDKESIAAHVDALGIRHVVFQGFSDNADQLLLHLKGRFGPDLRCHAVTHVTTAQFDHAYEMQIQARLLTRKRYGQIDNIASVKPDFGLAFEDYWPGLIVNFAPNIPAGAFVREANTMDAYAPLDIGWRKNMFTNIVGASLARNVERVKTANFPNGLESIYNLEKLSLVGYLRGRQLFAEMANSALVIVATLAECQPMTQLEAFAVGTPALTGPLRIADFAEDPLIELCTSDKLDNPALLARDIEKAVDAVKTDPEAVAQMIASHLRHRHVIAVQRYAELLGL